MFKKNWRKLIICAFFILFLIIACDMRYSREGDYTFEIYNEDWSTILKKWDNVRSYLPEYNGDYTIWLKGESKGFRIKGNIKYYSNKN